MRIYLTRTDSLRPRQWAGVSRYTACMTHAIRQQAPETEFVAAHFSLRGRLPPDQHALAAEFGVQLRPVRWPDLSGIAGYNEWLDRWVVPRLIQRAGAQIAWGTNCSVPSSRGRRFRSVVTIHDLFLLEHPELAAPEFYRHTLRQVRSLPGRCDLVLTDSEFSRNQIAELLGFPRERIVVTPLAPAPTVMAPTIDDPVRILARLGLKPPLLLSVGTVEARKNYVSGLQAFAQLRARMGDDVHWLIAGASGWQAARVYAERERLGLAGYVHVRHDISDAELASLYRAARCLFLPSPHEGFGLPALEAMTADLPVVAARAGALPEVVGDAAELVDPQSPPDMASGLMRVMTDDARRQQLIDRGRRRVSQFSWSAAARTAIEAFRHLIV